MVNFVICEDNSHVRKFIENIISKILMPYELDYRIHTFEKYNNELKNLINDMADIKIYILDLELPNKSGVEIAKEIRKKDWDSIIVISTSHGELELSLLKRRLLIFDFISKFDNYEKRLSETLDLIIKKLDIKKSLRFKSNRELHRVSFNSILYIYRDGQLDKTKIITHDNEYVLNDSLSSLIKKLDGRFYQTHRACYINKDNVKTVDFKNNILYFNGGKSIDYLSRNYKKELRNIL